MQHKHSTILKSVVAAVFISGLMSGCASLQQWKDNGYRVGPNYCRPTASVEVEWIDMQSESAPELSADAPDVASWWTFFNDPTLDQLVQSAYSQNLTLRQAGTRIQQAQALQGIATSNLFPQVQQAVGDFQTNDRSRHLANTPRVETFDQFDLGVKAAWELDFWGRFRRSIAAADASLDASIASYDDVAVILLSNVALTYIEIRTLQQRIALTQENIASQKGSLKLAEAKFEAAETNKLDVIQGKNSISITEAAIPTLEANLRIAANRLCVLLGQTPHDLLATLEPGSLPASRQVVRVGIPADLLRRRPDLRRSERLMKAQSERIGISQAQLYPRISLVGTFEWQAENFSDLFRTDSVFGLVGPSFSWNILNYGRIRNAVERERAKFHETVLQYRQNVLTAQQEVEDAIIGYRKAMERTDALRQAVNEIDEATQIALALYQSGATDFDRVYLLQSVRFSQQNQLVASEANEVVNLVQLYRALGGGWQIRTGQHSNTLPTLLQEVTPLMLVPDDGGDVNGDEKNGAGKASSVKGKDSADPVNGDSKKPKVPAKQDPDTDTTIQDALDAIRKAVDETPR